MVRNILYIINNITINTVYIYIYIYIYRKREIERDISIYFINVTHRSVRVKLKQ